ncbi:hypothetical protein NBRC10512_001565 [Rhodotorula toruloides]|uniref:RHTO0S12e03664g1_1 n=2 Tax=Rhodotorula toruloides TaxID=5286 RepID=A0A061B8W5_RHOTO|nr:uncharacterized protein RHTO_07519 [Rhodotorula toruloides NP11]EMS23177.1 hypothetical protein RHTO_07519 [Rhodotorula toruloides NP11]CDR46360.1 RHTO0S12e03664g1_1 [Rhodotorula toruloides]
MTASRLPNEILDRILVFAASTGTFTRLDRQSIVSAKDDLDDSIASPYSILRTCALVSPAWRTVAQARLFSLVRIHSPQKQCPTLWATLAARPDLARCVRTLRLEAVLTPEDEEALDRVPEGCSELSTVVFDGGTIDFRVLENLTDSDTVTRVTDRGSGPFRYYSAANPLPASVRHLSTPSVYLTPWVWPHVDSTAGETALLAWLTDSVEWLTLTGTIEQPDEVIYASHAISGQTSPGKLPYPFQRLKGIDASIGAKTAVEEMFPPAAAEMDRISVVWHVGWQDFVDRKPPWQDFDGSMPAHDPLLDAFLEEDEYKPPHAHKLEALYILPLWVTPTRAHLGTLATRVGHHGDPSLRHLKTLFLDQQWSKVLRKRGVTALDGQGATKVEIVLVGDVSGEEERVMGGGLADDDLGIPVEMRQWMERRRQQG